MSRVQCSRFCCQASEFYSSYLIARQVYLKSDTVLEGASSDVYDIQMYIHCRNQCLSKFFSAYTSWSEFWASMC